MSAGAGVIGPATGIAAGGAPERDNIYQMTFSGANVGQGQAELATARLKSAAQIKLEMPELVAPGEMATATVTITNSGAGHMLPTGLTEVRQMWLDVTALDASGETTTFGTHIFGTILQDDKGNAPVEMWAGTKIKSDDRIGPRESVSYSYTFAMPAGASTNSVKAALLYKSTPDELAEKAGVKNPVTEMAVAEQAVYANAAARDEATAASEETATDSGETGDGGTVPIAVWIAVAATFVAVSAVLVASRRAK